MSDSEIKEACRKLMQTADAAYLSTVDSDGKPWTRAILNLQNPEQYPNLQPFFAESGSDFEIYITTNTSSNKIRQIGQQPEVCVYFCNPRSFHGLMLSGKIEIVEGRDLKHRVWQDGWERYYPQGKDDPDYSLLHLQPVDARGWYRGDHFRFEL